LIKVKSSLFPEKYRNEITKIPATFLDTTVFKAKVMSIAPSYQLAVEKNWTCQTCLVSNLGSALKCIACTTDKPMNTKPVTGALFTNPSLTTKQSDTWTCSVCLVPNTMSAEKCVACTSEKPKSTLSKANRAVKSSGSGWTCSTLSSSQ
jgi:hypothetical protein